MRLSFHQRILLILICLGAVPTAAAILGWGLTIRSSARAPGARDAIEGVAASGRLLLHTIDSTRLMSVERRALADHASKLNTAIGQFQRADTFSRYYYAGLGLVILLLGATFIYASIRFGGHLSRQLSRPIEELIGWTGNIRRMEPLPPDRPRRGAPEFAALRTALREMASALERARSQEIEAERLRAFRETARRVAHEMRNPLTPMRLAVAQLARSGAAEQQEAIEVLAAESDRLEQLAREFTEFGRLPEGPAAPVDFTELLAELARTSLPQTMKARVNLDPATPVLLGHYDPLRRAFSNILRNAAEACEEHGELEITAAPDDGGGVRIEIRDHGPGVPADMADRIFDPYYTGKAGGTGLGLALVKQTIEMHGGTISLSHTPGGGATFQVRLGAR
ncbi:MAG TPA: HAMP domain-containing sensor histidine kinase [Gemmatimonadales bacterium]|jgi:two-component system nitrogen regulation sensor histidine kinase NtrY|nr:HAMP domain-containing sensor histidine kinase [Gemmatimonadales bacterium]